MRKGEKPMTEYRERNNRAAEIIERLNRRGAGWQKYDAASESQAAWKNQMMSVQEDIGLLCAEICEDHVMGEAWIQAQDKLKQYDPAKERNDGSGTVLLGEYIRMHVWSKWLRKKVKEEDEKDPGERRDEEKERKQREREQREKEQAEKDRAKNDIKPDEKRMPKRVSLDAIMGWGEDRNGTKNEKLFVDTVRSPEEEVISNLELKRLVITMMAMSLNFSDYRKRLKKKEEDGQKLYIKMCYTERLVWLEMIDDAHLAQMNAVMQKDILKAMQKTYYWYWADGKMHYDAGGEEKPIQIETLVTKAIKKLKWMKTKDGYHKGWLELDIPVGYLKGFLGTVVDKPRISEARKGYQQDLYKLFEMSYEIDRQPRLQKM